MNDKVACHQPRPKVRAQVIADGVTFLDLTVRRNDRAATSSTHTSFVIVRLVLTVFASAVVLAEFSPVLDVLDVDDLPLIVLAMVLLAFWRS